MDYDYIKFDKGGYAYNGTFPPEGAPDSMCWQKEYSGYKNAGEEAFLHNYAVELYDLEFKFNGLTYVLVNWGDADIYELRDADGKTLQSFSDPMDAVQHCEVQGHRLMDILDQLTDMECG
ncbi:MAG: hypothetical protein IJ222_02860 [Bacteroidales bacterium]|nr:hypothetical protein [Bacteroidales bacterium]